MSLSITLWSDFSKRENSTKTPGDSNVGVDVNVLLKKECSIYSPIFELNATFQRWTYALFNGAYYYVRDVVSKSNDIIELYCDMDYLATYKSNILSTNAFIQYTAINDNTSILDSRISQTQTITKLSNSVTMDFLNNETGIENWYTSATVAGNGESITYYKESHDIISAICNYIATLTESQVESLVLNYGNVFNTITAVRAIPYYLYNVTNQYIAIGDIETTILAMVPDSPVYTKQYSMSIPWVNGAPRRINERVYLYLPGIGTVNIDATQVYHSSAIYIDVDIDYVTGALSYTVSFDNDDSVLYFDTNLSIELQIGVNAQTGISGIIGNVLQGAQSAVNMLGGVISESFNAITSTLGYSQQILGANGSYSAAARTLSHRDAVIICASPNYSSNYKNMKNILGAPKYAAGLLSDEVGGYVKTINASVSIDGNSAARNYINSALNNGIYLE